LSANVDAHDQVRFGGAAGRLPGRPPALEGHPGQHRGLAGPGGRAADDVGRIGGVPEIGEDADTAPLELGGLRILILVDHIFVGALGHQPVGLRLHPGGDEGRQIEPGPPVQHQLIMNELPRGVGRHGILGQRMQRGSDLLSESRIGHGGERIAAPRHARLMQRPAGMQRHGPRPPGRRKPPRHRH
jgi:hypothetical protein